MSKVLQLSIALLIAIFLGISGKFAWSQTQPSPTPTPPPEFNPGNPGEWVVNPTPFPLQVPGGGWIGATQGRYHKFRPASCPGTGSFDFAGAAQSSDGDVCNEDQGKALDDGAAFSAVCALRAAARELGFDRGRYPNSREAASALLQKVATCPKNGAIPCGVTNKKKKVQKKKTGTTTVFWVHIEWECEEEDQ
jgi:ssDNA-binding Zn-finger/Zn-ribbon topoisomerase 1